MTPPEPAAVHFDDLLRESSWLRSLARRLVRDESHADDLVAQTVTAAVENPPRETERSFAWLRSVARRLAARSYREESRRRRRERSVATSEVMRDPVDLVERAELQQRVATAVLSLAEPYRTTILLRFFEDLSPNQIAEREQLPVATVHTRLSRALSQMRVKLDGEYEGNRQAWSVLLLPLATVENESISAASLLSTKLIGGAIMAKSSGMTALGIAILCLGGGVAIGFGMAGNEPEAQVATVSQEDYDALNAELAKVRGDLDRLSADKDELTNENATLESKVASLDAALAEATAPKPEVTRPESLLAIAFGNETVAELENADWDALAEVLRAIDLDVEKLVAEMENGGRPSAETQMRLGQANLKLQEYAIGIIGKLPTNESGNGEYSHPLSLANMMAAYLENGELPLTDQQRARIAEFGDTYTSDWDILNASYSEDTMPLEKFVDELRAKNEFVEQFQESLDAGQNEYLFDSDIRGRAALDPLSPAVMLPMKSATVASKSVEDLREKLIEKTATRLGIPADRLRNTRAVDDWMADLDEILNPVPGEDVPFFHVSEAVVAGRAQVRALDALREELTLTQEELDRFKEQSFLLIPRLVAEKEEGKEEAQE